MVNLVEVFFGNILETINYRLSDNVQILSILLPKESERFSRISTLDPIADVSHRRPSAIKDVPMKFQNFTLP
jgi:hypothetical protein